MTSRWLQVPSEIGNNIAFDGLRYGGEAVAKAAMLMAQWLQRLAETIFNLKLPDEKRYEEVRRIIWRIFRRSWDEHGVTVRRHPGASALSRSRRSDGTRASVVWAAVGVMPVTVT